MPVDGLMAVLCNKCGVIMKLPTEQAEALVGHMRGNHGQAIMDMTEYVWVAWTHAGEEKPGRTRSD